MRVRSALRFLFFLFGSGIVAGFLVGSSIAIYTIVVRNYVSYELYFLSSWTFKDQINSWIGTALLACTIAAGIAAAAFFLSRLASGQDRRSALFRGLYTAGLCLAVSVWAVFALHQNWGYFAPGKYHVKIFVFDLLAVAGIALLGWVSLKLNLRRFFKRIGPVFKVCAALVLVTAGVVNAGLFVYAAYCLPERPNVILISIDALRADHVGCYGYHRNTTPNIDAFARGSVIFENAFVHEPWTLPSHMSMLTGLYTITHGVYHWRPLSPRIITLTEYLKNAGYRTLGSVNTYWMLPIVGIGKGFDQYLMPSGGSNLDGSIRAAENQNKRIIKELEKKAGPFFAFIHYYDVHSNFEKLPYDAPPPFNQQFTSIGEDEFPFSVPGVYASEYLQYINQNKIVLSESERQLIIDLYDNGIAYMDYAIGQLLESLKSLGLYDNTMIIITADHGEEFQEHGWMLHSNPYYYDGVMRVPLIVKLPQGAFSPGTIHIDSLVELIDIKPSILDYVGIVSIFSQGESFMDIIAGRDTAKEYVYGLASTGALFVRSKKWKLMSDSGLDRNRYRLYDVENDPNEQHNVALDYPEIEEYLEEKLRARISESLELRARMIGARGVAQDDAPTRQFRLDAEQEERLRSLGYVL